MYRVSLIFHGPVRNRLIFCIWRSPRHLLRLQDDVVGFHSSSRRPTCITSQWQNHSQTRTFTPLASDLVNANHAQPNRTNPIDVRPCICHPRQMRRFRRVLTIRRSLTEPDRLRSAPETGDVATTIRQTRISSGVLRSSFWCLRCGPSDLYRSSRALAGRQVVQILRAAASILLRTERTRISLLSGSLSSSGLAPTGLQVGTSY